MYKHIAKVVCNICQEELVLDPLDIYETDSSTMREKYGWSSVIRENRVDHLCPPCRRIVGYTHAFGLAKAALQEFDPQTYGNIDEIVFRVGDKYLSHNELVDLTHSREKKIGR